jgi:hypothetical protein
MSATVAANDYRPTKRGYSLIGRDNRSIRFQSQDGPVSLHDLKPVDWPR